MDDERIAKTVQELLAEVAATRGAVNERLCYKGKAIPDALHELEAAQKAIEARQLRIGAAFDQIEAAQPAERGRLRRRRLGSRAGRRAAPHQALRISAEGRSGPPGRRLQPSEDQIAEAELAIKAVRGLMKTTSIEALPRDQRKSLSSFSLGSSGYFLPPEMSSTVLSCLEDTTDVTGARYQPDHQRAVDQIPRRQCPAR